MQMRTHPANVPDDAFTYWNVSTDRTVSYPHRDARLDLLTHRWQLIGEPQPVAPPPPVEPPPPERPADRASKAEWVAYAVALGVAEKDADELTRDRLVELHG